MQSTPGAARDGSTIEGSVTIKSSVAQVFGFYKDFRNLPRFLGDVMRVEPLGPGTARWTVQGPFGMRTTWTTRVTEERPNELLRYETVMPSVLKTSWSIHFAPGAEPGETDVHEVMKVPLGRFGRAALALIGKFPAEEMTSNLHRLKEVLETGAVKDTSRAVPGKFS